MKPGPRRYLFAGPTLPDAAELGAGRGVQVLPPVAGGDLLGLAPRPGDVIGIVDGYFHQTLAVRHKEILACLGAGAHVLGGASIGALRAAELDMFGMSGVGQIYQDYRDGTLTADDEVALSHSTADTGYRPLSEPLVNIRATLWRAEEAGCLDTATRRVLIGGLARLPYWRRSYPRLAGLALEAGMARPAVDVLARFCVEHPVNAKRADALRLFDAVCARAAEPCPAVPEVSRTRFLHAWEFRSARTVAADGTTSVSDWATLRACQLFDRDFPARYRALVLDRLVRECADHCGHPGADGPAERAVAHGVHRGIYPPGAASDLGFVHQWLTPAERSALSPHEKLVTFLVRGFRVGPGVIDDQGTLAALRAGCDLEPARTLVRAAADMNEQVSRTYPDFDTAALSPERITAWFAARWAATPGDLPLRVLDRGLESVAALVDAARPYFLLARYNPDRVRLRLTGLIAGAVPTAAAERNGAPGRNES